MTRPWAAVSQYDQSIRTHVVDVNALFPIGTSMVGLALVAATKVAVTLLQIESNNHVRFTSTGLQEGDANGHVEFSATLSNGDVVMIPIRIRLVGSGGGSYPPDGGGIDPISGAVEVYPEDFGARGNDDDHDDVGAIRLAAAAAAAEGGGAVVRFRGRVAYHLGSPLILDEAHSYLNFIGGSTQLQSAGELGTVFRKMVGWPGGTAVSVNTVDWEPGQPGAQSVLMEAIGIDGNGQDGDGLNVFGLGRHLMRRMSSFNNLDWGIRCDGVFFPTFVDCVARNNGLYTTTEVVARGGGVWLSNDIRENADGRWHRGFINLNAPYQLMTSPRTGAAPGYELGDPPGLHSQTFWHWMATELWHGVSFRPDAPETPENGGIVAKLDGMWATQFERVKFIGARINEHIDLITIGTPETTDGNWTEDAAFVDCAFQHSSYSAGDIPSIPKYAVNVYGSTRKIRIVNPTRYGNAKFIDLSNVTEGILYEDAIEVPPDAWNDPDRRIRNTRGGHLGPRAGSSPTAPYEWASDDIPFGRLGVRSSANIAANGDIDHRLDLYGDEKRLLIAGFGMVNFAARSASFLEGLTLVPHDIVYWNGNETFTTLTGFDHGPGLYRALTPTTVEPASAQSFAPPALNAVEIEDLTLVKGTIVYWDGTGAFTVYTGFTVEGLYAIKSSTEALLIQDL